MKSKSVSNIETRNDFISRFGEAEFVRICRIDPEWAKLQDIPIPKESEWIWEHFLTLFYSCAIDINGNRILRPVDIIDYCRCFGVDMTYRDRKLILAMKHWACSVIYQLETEKEE